MEDPGELNENIGVGHGSGAGVIDPAHAGRTREEQVGARAENKTDGKVGKKEICTTTNEIPIAHASLRAAQIEAQ